ncbi:XRE family transcriptional regulator [Bacillus toyonensis]|uniref:helix-turn-helix domain-containing protein n=1 Tax=Bacillus toyonensis TaxID=155322 RepID=UPI0008815F6A|nr:helix-turn-helix transcriptional regulator [Bacillus toyonensis]KAB2387538.1 helix-turn-helix transcriptional regulator [Bacillus toyonensis]PGB83761.1 XRE family transcriptional regulator [Bacillus toyonensis]SDL19259.1 DNA-binding transcriptional regulator, XRE-family HTH domain [Bacillus toyonensis]
MLKENLQQIIGTRIKEVRTKNKITQAQLAEKIGSDTKYIGHIEQGRRLPTLLTLKLIADALEITISELLKGI